MADAGWCDSSEQAVDEDEDGDIHSLTAEDRRAAAH